MIKQCVTLIAEKSLGIGSGEYRQALNVKQWKYYGDDKNAVVIKKFPHPHNEWLLWMVQWGIFGGIALVLWFGYVFYYFIRNFSIMNFYSGKTEYSFLGILLNVVYIISGGCESIFFRTLSQTVYVLGVCLCIAQIEVFKKRELRLFGS